MAGRRGGIGGQEDALFSAVAAHAQQDQPPGADSRVAAAAADPYLQGRFLAARAKFEQVAASNLNPQRAFPAGLAIAFGLRPSRICALPSARRNIC